MVDVCWIAIDKITPNGRNARTHSRKQIRQIADSIAAFGFVVPILIDDDGANVSGEPPGRAPVASHRQAGRAGCGCDEGLQPSRRHRARPLRWVRNNPPGSGARRAASLHARDRAPLRRRRDQALANLFREGCHCAQSGPRFDEIAARASWRPLPALAAHVTSSTEPSTGRFRASL
jgi:ParB-like nuclease family protein